MTIVNKVSFTNVGGGVDILDKIRTTAVSWGWTQAEWRDGVVFDAAANAWAADVNGGYLALTSPGQGGSQNLIAKLQVDKMYEYLTTEYSMAIGMCTSTAYDLTSVDLPCFQNSVSRTTTPTQQYRNHYGWSLPTTNIPEIWILGNSQYVCVVANLDGVFHTMMEFGSHEMRQAAPTLQNGSILSATNVDLNDPWHTYVDYAKQGAESIYQIPSVNSRVGGLPYWEDTELIASGVFKSPNYAGTQSEVYNTFTTNYSKLFNKGDKSGRRFMMKSTYLYERPSDGLIIPVSESHASVFNGHGLQPAQSIFYGTDEYIIFPACSTLSTVWIAFRIA